MGRSARLLNGLLIAAADDSVARRALLQALTAGLRRTTRNLYRRMCDVGTVVSLPWSSRTELKADAVGELLWQVDRAAGYPLAHPAARLVAANELMPSFDRVEDRGCRGCRGWAGGLVGW